MGRSGEPRLDPVAFACTWSRPRLMPGGPGVQRLELRSARGVRQRPRGALVLLQQDTRRRAERARSGPRAPAAGVRPRALAAQQPAAAMGFGHGWRLGGAHRGTAGVRDQRVQGRCPDSLAVLARGTHGCGQPAAKAHGRARAHHALGRAARRARGDSRRSMDADRIAAQGLSGHLPRHFRRRVRSLAPRCDPHRPGTR